MIVAAETERGTRKRSKLVTSGSTRMARNAASNRVIQKELAKKQKAMRRTRTMAQSSHAIRLNKRDWSNSVELRIIQISPLPRGIGSLHVRCPPCTQFERKEVRTSSSRYSLTSKKMSNQRDNWEHQQDVNQRAGHVKNQEATQPREEQNRKQYDEHVSLLFS